MADGGHAMAAFQVRVRLPTRFDAIEPVSYVLDVLVFPVPGGILRRLGPELVGGFGDRLRPADRMAAHNARPNVSRILLLVRNDLIAIAAQGHGAFVALEIDPAHSGLGKTCGAFAKLTYRVEAWIFNERVLHVRHFAVVFKKVAATGAGHGFGSFNARD